MASIKLAKKFIKKFIPLPTHLVTVTQAKF